MKKRAIPSPAAKPSSKPAAARELGGQPENDADARAAGFKSSTAEEKKTPRKKR